MKLEKLVLENFRSYNHKVEIDIDDLTGLIGKNDIGKSSILEALEIFFNNELVKIEQGDLSVSGSSELIRIGCVFSDLPEKVVIDASAETSLKQEYLLNPEGKLEIHKIFDCSKKSTPHDLYLVANYPTVEGASDLHLLTQIKLKSRIKELDIDASEIGDNRSNVSMRQGIYGAFNDLKLEKMEVPIKGDVKSVWEKIKLELPLYSLFQSDRPSLDGDSEVQDPMKLAIKEALKKVESQLAEIKENVEKEALKVAANTVLKIKEMDENLAKELKPQFLEEPKWHNIFKLTLDGDNGVPINKRGSGVRRLILLNFFRAEAERKLTDSGSRSVIYAIEEPETAQHPSNQLLLAEALKNLSENANTQVLLTTHVPGFASLLPTTSLRYIKQEGTEKVIQNAGEREDTIKEIAEALGVLPPLIDENVRVAVIVEGIHDVVSLKAFSKVMSEYHDNISDLNDNKYVLVLPSGGNTLKEWVNNQYLKALGIPEVHIYDSDNMTPPKYDKWCQKVNARGDGSVAFSTRKRELENYIHPDAIREVFGVDIQFTSECSVPKLIAERVEPNAGTVKKMLNNKVAPIMTYGQILEMDTEKEIESWLVTISNYARVPVVK